MCLWFNSPVFGVFVLALEIVGSCSSFFATVCFSLLRSFLILNRNKNTFPGPGMELSWRGIYERFGEESLETPKDLPRVLELGG